MQDYRKLQVWNRSHLLVLDLYKIVNQFPKEEQFGLISQIKRASSSIPANIAEGCGRNSNKDFAQFLNISMNDWMDEVLCHCKNSREFQNLSAIKYRLPGLLLLACRHYEYPLPYDFFI